MFLYLLKFWHCNAVQRSCVSAVVGVDAGLDEASVDDVSQCEDRIVSQWREVSADEQNQLREQFDEILRPLGLKTRLVVVERDNSIALCFVCMTLSALTTLRDQWRNGQLRDVINSLFTLLSGASTVRVKRLTWPLADYERCSEFFKSAQSKPTVYLNDNRGYSKNMGSHWIRLRSFFSKIFHGLVFGWTLWMYLSYLQSVALAVPEIIVIAVWGVGLWTPNLGKGEAVGGRGWHR